MSSELIRQIFDKVLLLKEGEKIILKFPTERDAIVKKTALFKERKKYEKNLKGIQFKDIFIVQHFVRQLNRWELHLSTSGTDLDWIGNAILKTKEGEEKVELLKPGVQARINALKND